MPTSSKPARDSRPNPPPSWLRGDAHGPRKMSARTGAAGVRLSGKGPEIRTSYQRKELAAMTTRRQRGQRTFLARLTPSVSGGRAKPRRERRRPRYQPGLEALEERWVPATLTVTSLMD